MCGERADAPHALTDVAKLRPDVVIVDLSLERGSGLDLIKDLRIHSPESQSHRLFHARGKALR